MIKLLTRRGALVEELGSTYMADNEADSDEARALRPLQAAACTYRQGSKQNMCADIDGFSLHAAVRCKADERAALEQLCRYITRPALANERVQCNAAGQVVLKLKRPWRDGTTHLVMSPLEFMQRLAALVPRPRLHLIRLHGVLARSAVREAVTHYQAAVALLGSVQLVEPCAEVELGLRFRLGNALIQTEGFISPGAHENYMRARDLAFSLDRPDDHLQACGSIAAGLNFEGRFSEAIEMLERFGPAELARVKPMARVNRLLRMGYPRTLRGELVEAWSRLAEARLELENVMPEDWQPLGGGDPMVAILMHLNQNLAPRGLLSSAEACAREGLAIAERRQHPNSRVWALSQIGVMSALKGDWADAITRTTQAVELAERYGLKAYDGWAKTWLGWALVATGQLEAGTRLLRDGYAGWTTFSGRYWSTHLAAIAAAVLLDAGCRDEATEFMLAGEKTQQGPKRSSRSPSSSG